MTYTRLDNVIDELKGDNAYAGAKSDEQIMRYIRTVTNRIRAFRYEFEPQYITHKLTPTRQNVGTNKMVLTLPDNLLEPKTITVGGTAATWGTTVVASPDDGQYPIHSLRIVDPVSGPLHSWYPIFPTWKSYIDCIVIAGFWGMREFYATEGFFDSGQVCPILTASQTTMVVLDVAGPDMYYRTPLFSAGNLIRIEDELIAVTNVVTATKTLTVLRGANGTTKTAHAAGTAISIWQPEQDIEAVATRQACLLYARRGAYQQVSTYPDGTNVTYPSDLLAELRAVVQRFNTL